MKTTGIQTIIYIVNDINKAKEWYSKAFDTLPYFDEPFYVGFNIQGYELGLQPEENNQNIKQESVVGYWGVEYIHVEYQKLINLGAKELEKPHDVGGDIITATCKDPWGNTIGLIYNPHFKLNI